VSATQALVVFHGHGGKPNSEEEQQGAQSDQPPRSRCAMSHGRIPFGAGSLELASAGGMAILWKKPGEKQIIQEKSVTLLPVAIAGFHPGDARFLAKLHNRPIRNFR
jgi:hypothetical protein